MSCHVIDQEVSDGLAEGESLRGLLAEGCTFTGTAEGASLVGCTFTECTFEGVNLSRVMLTDTRLIDCTFRGAKMLAVNFALASWGAVGALRFENCQLDYASFVGVDARGFVFRDCALRDADFADADLRKVSFAGSGLGGTRFTGADLREADLRGASNYLIDPRETRVHGAFVDAAEALGLLHPFGLQITP